MDKQVADASAILAVILNEAHRTAVIAASENADLVSPGSLPWEVGNALVANVRRERLTGKQAHTALARYETIPIRLKRVSLDAAIHIALEEDIYAYDAYMLELAHRHTAPLLSVDLRLRQVARNRGLKVLPEHVEGDERYQ